MPSVLIVESPAKCSKIRGFLGPGWTVIATMGHIRALDETLDAVGLDRDFEPRFQFLKEKGKAIAAIKEAAAPAGTKVYLAADDDREGEAIAYSVMCLLKLPATAPRAVFHEITKDAVLKAVANPRQIDMNRVWAQQARAVLDMMVGFTISPLLWKYVGPALSAGRCQTPALRLLADREKEIGSFSAETVWRVKGGWTFKGPAFEAVCVEDLENEESASNFLENLHDDAAGHVVTAATRPYSEAPPKPLITSTLQQEASAIMGVQPKNTMRIAQRLYEAGHITYMRTDSAVLCEEAVVAARAWVTEAYGDAFLAAAGAGVVDKPQATRTKAKKVVTEATAAPAAPALVAAPQEAHEAIRPTHFELVELPADEDWNASDRRIYKLVWQRAVQSVMAAARGERRTVDLVADGDPNEFLWRATWSRELFAGWRRIGAAATNLDETDEGSAAATAATAWSVGAALEVGAALKWTYLEAAPHVTKAPGRYTEATLVRELERKGIGRPSTFATLVGTVLEKGYAEKRDTEAKVVQTPRLRVNAVGVWPPTLIQDSKKVGAEKQKLAPTALGLSVLEFCLREFGQLFTYDFTSAMESRLDAIAVGGGQWKDLCRETWGSYRTRYEELKSGASTAPQPDRQRMFAGGIKAVQSKKGPLLLKETAGDPKATVFFGWPAGISFRDITEADVATFVATKTAAQAQTQLGIYNGQPIMKKSGPYGAYAECGGVKIPLKEATTEEALQAAFAAKVASAVHTLGPFEFRTGPYGMFMFKTAATGKARQFVNVPSGIDPKTFTLEAATRIYQTGLQTKAKGKAFAKAGAGAGAAAGAKAKKDSTK